MAIQVVYSHYMLTPSIECLWYVKFWHLCFKQEDQSIQWMTKGQAMVLRVNVLWYKGFVFRQQSPVLWEKTGPLHLALVGLMAGRQAGRQAGRWNTAGFRSLENPLQVKLFVFYFVYSSAMLLIVLEVHFSLLFSNKAHFRVCFVVRKIRSPLFFMSIPTISY